MTTWIAKKRKKNGRAARTAAVSRPVMLNVCVQMNGSGHRVPMTATRQGQDGEVEDVAREPPRVIVAALGLEFHEGGDEQSRQDAAGNELEDHVGDVVRDDVRGRERLRASANAVAHMRTKPVTRDSVVAVDIVTVERAIEGLLMAFLRVSRWRRCSAAGRASQLRQVYLSGPVRFGARAATSTRRHFGSARVRL